jgi:hypothetical protein
MGIEGPLALFTAGWRHDEDETAPLREHVGRPVRHIRLYHEMDRILSEDPAFAAKYRERQRRVMAYKDVYRISLRAATVAIRELSAVCAQDVELYGADLEDAFSALRAVDERLLARLARIHAAHPDVSSPWRDHAAAAVVYARVREALHGVGAVLIAGGHVAVLRNRLRFFGVDGLLREVVDAGVPLIAWSAGAMALTRRIVLFYDDPPEGHGDAEVHGAGFGLLPGVVLLPHARLRLTLEDQERVSTMARRYFPDACIGLEPGAWLVHSPAAGYTDASAPESSFLLQRDGTLGPVVFP